MLSGMSYPLSPDFTRTVPDGDTHERFVCENCGFVAYENPRIVVGAVVRYEDRILMCRRAIEPRKGFWTVPAGFLELHETPEDGARREAMEEATADLVIDGLLAVYSVPHLSQVQLIYRAHLSVPDFAAGVESIEVGLFTWNAIPWDELAFPTVRWMLLHEREVREGRAMGPFSNPEADYAAGTAG